MGEIDNDNAKPGDLYVHWKGGVYTFLAFARLESDLTKQFVVYRSSKTGETWILESKEFFGMVDNVGSPIRRFMKAIPV